MPDVPFRRILLVVSRAASPRSEIDWTLLLGRPKVTHVWVLGWEEGAPTLPKGSHFVSSSSDEKWHVGIASTVDAAVRQLTAAGVAAVTVAPTDRGAESIVWASAAVDADLVVLPAAFGSDELATSLARIKHELRRTVLFVRSAPDGGPILLASEAASSAESYLAREISSYLSKDLVTWTSPSTTRTIAAQIASAARSAGAQLVVMGSHGRGPVARVALGSVSDEVARRSGTSVLVTPTGHQEGDEAPRPALETSKT